MLTKDEISAVWKKSKLSPKVFARLMGLKFKSSLYAYMSGDKQISKKFSQRVEDWQRGGGRRGEIISKLDIPPGTLLPDRAEIYKCVGCGKNFIRMNKRCTHHKKDCGRNRDGKNNGE